jgi:hypothetical protein
MKTPRPWEYRAPPFLYKYFPPERFHILTDCTVRFSQRAAFDDERELQPEVAAFGTEEEIRNFATDSSFVRQNASPEMRQILSELVVQHILHQAGEQQRITELTQASMRSPDECGMFCLSEESNCERMWVEYASGGRGFVVAFDTRHRAFTSLIALGRLGRVDYGDAPMGTFLGSYGAAAFFRKRLRYSFESEWRVIRLLTRLRLNGSDSDGNTIYLGGFNPDCLRQILVRPECAVEMELRFLAATDGRYRHITVNTCR